MTSSDMNESVAPLASTTTTSTFIDSQPKKHSPSVMSPPHSVPWSPAEPSADTPSQEGLLKAYHQLSPSETTILPQPWTNVEQEALYVAVERYNLFGRWEEVRNKMQLDRTSSEIEQEYMQLYGELPESEDDDDDEDWSGQGKRAESTRSHMPGHVTPSLTSTSSSSLSARSSQETFRAHYGGRPSFQKTHASLHALNAFHGDENDDSRMDIGPHVPAPRRPNGKTTNGRPRSESTAAPTPVEGKPTRTIRVWTQQQSEQLKNLIEDCFPGGYRINWVWVASKMGNTFTRKQCKNKWEIMRRRAGTEEEINLLKLGHAEFGPSWSQIQEKYLPERSQGGISIMWSLLQAREAEKQQQGNTRLDMGNSSRSTSSSPLHSRKETPRTMVNSRQEAGDAPGSKKSKDMSYQPRISQRPIGNEQEGMQQQLSDREMMDRPYSDQSRETSMSPAWNREGMNTASSPCGPYKERAPSKRLSVSSTESLTMRQDPQPHHHHHHHHPYQQHHSYRHQTSRDSVPTEPASESWTERNRPMTWTEPLTRRLEGIILKHFPNHQKVNWVKVSSLMGTTPVVTKDQCKRRWYLMSQNNNHQQQHRKTNQPQSPADTVMSGSTAMDVDMDPVEEAGTF